MQLRRFPDALESAAFLDAPADALMGAVSKAIPAGPVKDALSGTWLGHAVHPALTDLPIGFWTSAWMLDLIGGKRSANAARMLVGLGIASAIPTAATGASDWADTAAPEKRVGLVHAAANSIALACYIVSFVHRVRGRRTKGVLWGLYGATAATVGGALGGHLVQALGIGVDNTVFDQGPEEWTAAGSALDLVEGEPMAVTADCIECPWHQSRFRLEDGEVAQGPAVHPQPRFEARVVDGVVEVRAKR
jgi:uncharacterized membrane protein